MPFRMGEQMKIIDQAKKKKIKGQTCIDIILPDKEGWIRIRFPWGDYVTHFNGGDISSYYEKNTEIKK